VLSDQDRIDGEQLRLDASLQGVTQAAPVPTQRLDLKAVGADDAD
jgi:hypothetical protein